MMGSRSERVGLAVAVCLVVAACKGGGGAPATGTAGSGGGAGATGASGTTGASGATGVAGTSGTGAAGTKGSAGVAGTSGGAGTGGSGGGKAGTSGVAGQACGPPAPTYEFTRVKVRDDEDNTEQLLGLYLRPSDGVPLFVILDRALPDGGIIKAVALPELPDGGLTVTMVYPLTKAGLYLSTLDPDMPFPMRVGKNGDLHVTYVIPGAKTVHHLRWNGDPNEEPADEVIPADVGSVVIAQGFDLDPQDRPAITYHIDNDRVRFAWKTDTGWVVETAATPTLAETLAFDGAGTPFVAGPVGVMPFDFRFTTRGPTGWSALASVGAQPLNCSVPLAYRDGLGQVEAFCLGNDDWLRLVRRGTTWDTAASFIKTNRRYASTTTANRPAVAMGKGGHIHVVTVALPASAVDGGAAVASGTLYAYFDGCTWSTQVIDVRTDARPAIALDAAGNPRIALEFPVYYPGAPKSLKGHEIWYLRPNP